jgi:hypothetical protein
MRSPVPTFPLVDLRTSGRPYHWVLVILAGLTLAGIADVQAQDMSQFFSLEKPGHFTLRLFAVGYGAEKYGTTHEGFEVNQTVTQAISVVGRISTYQIYQGAGFDSPLKPAARSAPRNFGRFEGGLSLTPFQGMTFNMLGGADAGDSAAPVLESDFSSWVRLQSHHPVNISYSSSHFYENGVTNGLIDLRTVAASTARLMLFGGVGGAVWGGGSVGQAKGQGGLDFGLFVRAWHLSIDTQTGYGSSHMYGMVSASRSFGWDE